MMSFIDLTETDRQDTKYTRRAWASGGLKLCCSIDCLRRYTYTLFTLLRVNIRYLQLCFRPAQTIAFIVFV